jgi:hypothetical protein
MVSNIESKSEVDHTVTLKDTKEDVEQQQEDEQDEQDEQDTRPKLEVVIVFN